MQNISQINKVAILGYFDLIHRGHQLLIVKAKRQFPNLKPVVYTIDHKKNSIFTTNQRVENFRKIGIDVVILDFEKIKNWRPIEFINYLKAQKVKAVICGSDYRFGKKRAGNVQLLERYFLTKQCFLKYQTHKISSQKIRQMIEKNQFDKIANFLTKPLHFSSTVKRGKQIGRTIGFPTANLDIPFKLTKGVYCVQVNYLQKQYKGIMNIGLNPTVTNDQKIKCEVHIFDFKENIYDQEITIQIKKFIRPEKKFSTLEKLKNQIKIDCEKCKKNYMHN